MGEQSKNLEIGKGKRYSSMAKGIPLRN